MLSKNSNLSIHIHTDLFLLCYATGYMVLFLFYRLDDTNIFEQEKERGNATSQVKKLHSLNSRSHLQTHTNHVTAAPTSV